MDTPTTEMPNSDPAIPSGPSPELPAEPIDPAEMPPRKPEAPVEEPAPEPGRPEQDDERPQPEPTHSEEEVVELLSPKSDKATVLIGKPPDKGGTKDQFEVYTQQPLGHIDLLKFYALIGNVISESIKAGGTAVMGMDDVFGPDAGSIRQRIGALSSQDLTDASGFATVLFKVLAFSPDLMLDFNCIALEIPNNERQWARAVMSMPYRPDDDKWGLTSEQSQEIIERFVDQNYEDIRRFFAESLPAIAKRATHAERRRQEAKSKKEESRPQDSEQVPSKPLKPTQPATPNE